MKNNIKFFLTRIIIPGLIVWFILSAGFMFLNRHNPKEPDIRKKHKTLLNCINHPDPSLFTVRCSLFTVL